MRRRFLCYMLVAALSLSFAACTKEGQNADVPATEAPAPTEAPKTQEETPAPTPTEEPKAEPTAAPTEAPAETKPEVQDAAGRIEFENFTESDKVGTEGSKEDDTEVLAGLNTSGYTAYNIDLGDGGYEQIAVRYASDTAGGKIEIRYTAPDGDLVGTIELPGTGGWDKYQTVTADIPNLKDFGRKKLLYFVFSGDGYLYNLNWFQLFKVADGSGQVEFENYVEAIPGIVIDNASDGEGAQNIGGIKNDYWTLYKLNFGEGGFEQIAVRASSATAGGSFEIRLGSLDNAPVGKFNLPGTGDWNNWDTYYFDVPEFKEISGVQDVYMVYNDGGDWLYNLNWFRFYKAALDVSKRVEAEDFIESTVVSEPCGADGTNNIGGVTPGTYAAYQLDFGEGGYNKLKVRASSPMSGGEIIMHKDSLDGEVVCKIAIGNKDVYGGDWSNYGDWDFETPELAALTGKQILFFEFNNSPENSSHLFNINWYEFTK
ncbi:MAG: carbohydrate-binding protein [Lachnospiraceae bacterium]|nr:carbohydrate-binding protein [Lachnospiraceae bacterium]